MQRLGIVFLAPTYPRRPGDLAFTGYWDRGDPPEVLEQGPGWDDVEEAVAWGRARAPKVVLRLGATDDTIYSAGEAPLTEFADGTGRRYPAWP